MSTLPYFSPSAILSSAIDLTRRKPENQGVRSPSVDISLPGDTSEMGLEGWMEMNQHEP